MELAHQLAEQLIALEAQAAQVAALIDGAPPEVVEQALAAFAPLPAMKGAGALHCRQRRKCRQGLLHHLWRGTVNQCRHLGCLRLQGDQLLG